MKILVPIAIVLSLLACAAASYLLFTHKQAGSRVCIVRMSVIMERYQGALDASAQVQKEQSRLQMNIDSLVRTADSGQDRVGVSARQEQVQRYIQVAEQKAAEDQAALSKRLMSHIKSASETVSDELKLDLILAVTDEAFVLSKSEAIDVTNDVLRELKRSYRDEFKR